MAIENLADEERERQRGLGDVAQYLLKSYGVKALSGIHGLSNLPSGMDAAADSVNRYQNSFSPRPEDLSQSGRTWVHDTLAPIADTVGKAAKNAAPFSPLMTLSAAYPHAVEGAAGLAGKYLGAPAAGVVGAVGEAAPYAGFPEGSAEEIAASGSPDVGRAISVSPGAESHLAGSVPDNAKVYVSHDPQTGEVQGHAVIVPRSGGMQIVDTYVKPELRGKGIGTDILKSAIHDTHADNMPFLGDTSVSPEHMATVHQTGHVVEINPNVEESENPKYGLSMNSTDGRPAYAIQPPIPADDATPNDQMPGLHMAEGGKAGEIAPFADALNALRAAYAPKELAGLPKEAMVKGVGSIIAAPNPVARQAAANYMREAGITSPPQMSYATVDPERAKAIAAAFDAMEHNPSDHAVKASYDALAKETLAQYQHVKNAGLKVDFIQPGQPDPYAASPRLAIKDINENNHFSVFPTSSGFGNGDPYAAEHPMLADSGETIGGQPATMNDIFRVVHDYFGHAKEGVGFRANGEENAWNQHARMYSDLARPAMTAETRGQNSWVNFGPFAEQNKGASGAETTYAPQKTGLLPPEHSEPDDGHLHFLHMGNPTDDTTVLDPSHYGEGMPGNEWKRGALPTTSLYPWDVKPEDVELPLRGKTPYHVMVPKASMYDMSADPLGIRRDAPSFTAAEEAVRNSGFSGYHTPNGEGGFRGQGRLFGPVEARKIGEPIANTGTGSSSIKPSDIVDDTTDTSDFAKGGAVVRRFADGGTELGELAPIADSAAELLSRYGDHAAQAQHIADTVAQKGSATYNPTTGDMHTSGYAIPHEINRSVAMDTAPTASDIHDFLVSNQDAFANPKAALHVEGDDAGNHFLHVAHIEPDFDSALAAAKAFDVPSVRELHTGVNLPSRLEDSVGISGTEPDHEASDVEDYLAGSKIPPANLPAELDLERNQRPRTAWNYGKPTVDPAQRVAFPGIYSDPRQVIADANKMVGPEDPLLQQLFGHSRQDLSDIALSRQGNELGVLPGAKQNPNGAASARAVMTPQNEQRLIDTLDVARGTPLYTGMTGWYSMDPLYERFRQIFGDEEAPARYAKFNTLTGMASPGSDVGTEIARGSSAHWLANNGRFQAFLKYAGLPEGSRTGASMPVDMQGIPGHPYHMTAQGIPMESYLRTGQMQMQSPKVPLYIGASGVPETGFQSDFPVGDAHWARGVGLADTRNPRTLKGQPIVPGASASTPEMQLLGPWWRDRVAAQAGYDAVPAQATLWGSYAPYTGVESAIGAPKLEILSTQIGKLANRLGVSPETARDLVITGKAGAFRDGGFVFNGHS